MRFDEKHYWLLPPVDTDFGWRDWHPQSLNLTCEFSMSTLHDSCKVSWRGMQLSNSGWLTTALPPCRQFKHNYKWSDINLNCVHKYWKAEIIPRIKFVTWFAWQTFIGIFVLLSKMLSLSLSLPSSCYIHSADFSIPALISQFQPSFGLEGWLQSTTVLSSSGHSLKKISTL